MSKERLEEIRQRLVLLHNAADVDDETKSYIFEYLKVEWLIERVQELEDIIYQDERQVVLEGMYEQNKRYRETREIIEQVYKENYVRNAFGYEDGYLDGLDTAIDIIDKALEESE